MAMDFSKWNFFNRLNARARIIVLVLGVVGVISLIYFGTRYLSGGSRTTGPSRVATAPQGLQSVPGGQLTPEYYRALVQANSQAAQQAQISGGSAVSTLINVGGQPSMNQGCVICSEENANVKNYLDDWVRQGKIAPDVANDLEQLASKNVPIDEYAAALDRLVKEGKLTPEQARLLLAQYKKQHANALVNDSAKAMDAMIKSGQLPLSAANDLLTAQKNGATPAQYAAMLQRLVREGKITPDVAQKLLAQYSAQRAKEITMRSIAVLQKMSSAGEITPEVLNGLVKSESQMIPLEAFTAQLQGYVTAGKLTPAVSARILDEYKQQKAEIGSTGTIEQLIREAEAAAFQEISTLLQQKKITPDVAAQLTDMIQKNVTLEQFKAAVANLVQQGKLTPEIAQLKIGDYTKVKELRDEQQRLAALQANNANPSDYADELKRAVAAGVITPSQAAQMLRDYQAMTAIPPTEVPTVAGPGTEAFAALQQRVDQGTPAAPAALTTEEFATAQTQATQETAQERQARLQAIMNAMSGQAGQLISSWQPPVMLERVGSGGDGRRKKEGVKGEGASVESSSTTTIAATGAPLIKAGSILFAVLDTAVNSDYPDSPVMATIVAGQWKGAKLLGKLTTAKNVAGQLDRVSLNFTLMNLDAWPKTKAVTAYAIDPDTARTVLASEVNYHYLKRFGAMFATSFLQGYANAITTSSSTSTTGIFGTSTTHPELSPGSKLAVGLGQVGQTLGNVTQSYANIPPTVKVDSGVGLGILFMADVT